MTLDEMSNTMDTLLNSYNSQSTFGEGASKQDIVLDEYEKSVLLTQAQDNIVKSYFDATLNSQRQGFDDSARRQIDYSSLIKVATLTPVTDATVPKFDERGIIYSMPLNAKGTTDVLYILNEKLSISNNGTSTHYVIVPINYKDYDREMSTPYAQPLKKQAWRLFQNQSTGFDLKSELIPNQSLVSQSANFLYKIRYIQRPTPIVLVNLPNGLDIDGYNEATACTLNPILHMDIVQKAVDMAIQTRLSAAARYDSLVNQNKNQQ